jgi:hypothetical protein
VGFADGKHGTEIIGPHPELPRRSRAGSWTRWKRIPADPKANVDADSKRATREFWTLVDEPGGIAKAAQLFRATHQRDRQAFLFPEGVMNLAGYERLQPAGTGTRLRSSR